MGVYDNSENEKIIFILQTALDCRERVGILQDKIDRIIEAGNYYSGYYKSEHNKAVRKYALSSVGKLFYHLISIVVAIGSILLIGTILRNSDGIIDDWSLDDLYHIFVEILLIPILAISCIIYFIKDLLSIFSSESWGSVKRQWKQYLKENPDIAAAGKAYCADKSSINYLLEQKNRFFHDAYSFSHELGVNINSIEGVLKYMNNGYSLNEAKKANFQEIQRIQAQVEENRRRMESDWERQQNYNDQIEGLRAAIEEADRNADARYRDQVYRKKIDDLMKRR